ncbi:MAG: DUF7681 family protein [Gemmatimonadota bacterium]
MPSEAEIRKRFTYHPPTSADQQAAYADIRNEALDFAMSLCYWVPESRELSLALTKLEECVMHANSGIARRGVGDAVGEEFDDEEAPDA